MNRLLLLISILFTTAISPAADTLIVVKDEQGRERFETWYRLTPMLPEKPYTKYSLYWDYSDRISGNAALYYEQAYSESVQVASRRIHNNSYELLSKIWDKAVDDPPLDKAFLVQNTFPYIQMSNKTEDEKHNFTYGYYATTWDYSQTEYFEDFESHLDETRDFVDQYNEVFRLMERGSRCDHFDFGISLSSDFITELPSTIQHIRELARLLAVKIRLEIAEGKYEEAVKSIRTGMEMAKHLGDQPPLICPLVGIAIHGIVHAQLMELLERKDSPNLYWAMSNRPNPYFNFAQSVQAEKTFLYQIFPLLKKTIENTDLLSDAEWELFCKQADNMISEESQHAPQGAQIPEISVEIVYPEAKKWLVKQGKTESEINAISKEKAVGLHAVGDIQIVWGNCFSTVYLPIWEITEDSEKDKQLFYRESLEGLSPYAKFLGLQIYPPIDAGKNAFRRVQVQTDGVRISQAIRMYMAENDGKLPTKLDDIKNVTVPCVDPYTGKPYRYRLENGVGIIDIPEHTYPLKIYFEPQK